MNKTSFKRTLFTLIGIGALTAAGLTYGHFRGDMAQRYQQIASGGKRIETPYGSIEYAEFGQGTPVLVLHGTGGGYDQGVRIAQTVGGDFHWIAPSRFGYLRSPVPDHASSAMQADAYACLLDTLGIQRVAIVAYSGGGPSALLFALRYPQRVSALVILSAVSHAEPAPAQPGWMGQVYRSWVNDFVYWAFVHTSKPTLLSLLGVPTGDQKTLPQNGVAQAYQILDDMMPMGARRAGLIFDIEQMPQYDAEQIQQIQAPTLVVHARNDTLVPFAQGEFTAARVPGAQLLPLEKGGHFALLFYPEMRANLVSFLEQHHP